MPGPPVSQTPVDLHDYTTRLRAPAQQSIDMTAPARMSFARRQALDMSSLPKAMAVGAENQMPIDEPESPLDVPAFLRRQSES